MKLDTGTGPARNTQNFSFQQHLNAFVFHQFQERLRHVWILFFEQLFPMLNDRDPAAEASHRLSKLQTDIATANNDEMFGQPFEIERFDMRQRRGGGKSGHLRYGGARANIKEDTLTAQAACPAGVQRYIHDLRFGEAGFAHDQLRTACFELVEVELDQIIDHLSFAANHASHIDTGLTGHDSQAGLWIHKGNGLGAINDILARQTSHIRTRPPDHRAFDHNRFLSHLRQIPREDFSRHTTSDHEIVTQLQCHDESPFNYQRPKCAPPSTYRMSPVTVAASVRYMTASMMSLTLETTPIGFSD